MGILRSDLYWNLVMSYSSAVFKKSLQSFGVIVSLNLTVGDHPFGAWSWGFTNVEDTDFRGCS